MELRVAISAEICSNRHLRPIVDTIPFGAATTADSVLYSNRLTGSIRRSQYIGTMFWLFGVKVRYTET